VFLAVKLTLWYSFRTDLKEASQQQIGCVSGGFQRGDSRPKSMEVRVNDGLDGD